MGCRPGEASQDADELRAGVESLTSGPGGSGMGDHISADGKGERSLVHCCTDKSRKPKSLPMGRNCFSTCVAQRAILGPGCAQPHTMAVSGAYKGSLLPSSSISKVPGPGRLGVSE